MKATDIPDFKIKSSITSEYVPRICQYLQDNYGFGQEGVIAESPNVTTIHNMIGDDPKSIFPHHIDVHHFTIVSLPFTYWLYDCLSSFNRVFKKVGVYEEIWISRYKQQLDEVLLKGLVG